MKMATEGEIPKEWAAKLDKEDADAQEAAEAFERVCREGDAALMRNACGLLSETDGWLLAMCRVGSLPKVTAEIKQAFVNVWVEHKNLPLSVGDHRIMAKALRILMPRNYEGENPLRLYRGASAKEYEERNYGFSWSTHRNIAWNFAAQRQKAVPAVVLKTLAPAKAILLKGYYDEGEVVVDPFRLETVQCVECLSKHDTGS